MIKLILKGFIIGIGKIMPGVSGAMLAMSLGIYENAIEAINNFFKNPIKNFKYLLSLFIGAFLAITLMSKVIILLLNNFYLATMLLFIGLMIGGFPSFIKKMNIKKAKIHHYLVMFLSFVLILIIEYYNKGNLFNYNPNFKSYFFIGFIDAATMIIPGLCGTAIMMLLGCYDLLLNLMSNISSISGIIENINLLIPYSLGILSTVLLLSKIMGNLFNKESTYIYFIIFGFALGSVIVLFISTFNNNYSVWEILISIVLLIFGYFIGYKLEG